MHGGVRWLGAGVMLAVGGVVAVLALSGGSSADRPVPRGLPGPLPSFFATGGEQMAGQLRAADERDEVVAAIRAERRWLRFAGPLARAAPPWARRMYERSLLVLRAATDPRSGAVVAGAPPGWAYVWPRDAGAVAIAFASAGYRGEARRIARFLLRLDLDAAARFYADGEPVDGREEQGDAAGWVAAAARAAGIPAQVETPPWRDRADYQEKEAGDYLGNAIASVDGPKTALSDVFSSRRRGEGIPRAFGAARGLVRRAGDPGSGLDTAAAWAVEPFPRPQLFPALRRTLLRLGASGGRFGLLPSEDWDGGEDPWTAPTAWTAWSLAALGERRAALRLTAALRRAATPAGLLPERVDAQTGAPRSTTPLAWSHAFAVLALRELWPTRR